MSSPSYVAPEVSYSHWGMFKDDRPTTVNITNNITISHGTDKEEIRRTMYQAMEKASKALR